MGNTSIQWTDKTWNPTRGCSRVSPGCTSCYAERIAYRFSGPSDQFAGFAKKVNGHASWTGKVELIESMLDAPLHWRRPCRIFVNSMSDLFHEALPGSDIFKVFVIMAASPQHTFQILTKRAARMREWINNVKPEGFPGWPLPNVWLGISAEDQQRADERVPLLLQTPAAVRFVSYEPALGPVDFDKWFWGGHGNPNWIIVGGESGPGARPFNIVWARNTIEQCKAAGVACFVKQLGAKPFIGPKKISNGVISRGPLTLKDRKGGEISEWPEDLRVREFPNA